MWTDWSCAVNRNRKVGTNSLEPRGTNTAQTKGPLIRLSWILLNLFYFNGWLHSLTLRENYRCRMLAWARCFLPKKTKKKMHEWSKTRPVLRSSAALVPPSVGTLDPVTSGCLPNGPQAQGPLKGWVPSLNKAWEMPARPGVTNGLSETCTCYHEKKRNHKKMQE